MINYIISISKQAPPSEEKPDVKHKEQGTLSPALHPCMSTMS